MARIQDIDLPYLEFGEAAAPGTPAAGVVRIYAKTDGSLYQKDDAGTETGLAGGGGGTTIDGRTLQATPTGFAGITGSFGWAANEAHAWAITIPAPMLLQSASFDMGVAASGTYEWGLFDFAADPTAATKLAGGSGTLNATGWQTIAAGSAPVTIDPGGYVFIAKAPAANTGEIRYFTQNTMPGACLNQTSYTWDDTPNLTTGWTAINGVYRFVLNGRLNSTEQWP